MPYCSLPDVTPHSVSTTLMSLPPPSKKAKITVPPQERPDYELCRCVQTMSADLEREIFDSESDDE